MFKSSAPTSHGIDCITIIQTNRSIPHKEIISIYSENHTKNINTLCRANVKAGGTYRYHGALNG